LHRSALEEKLPAVDSLLMWRPTSGFVELSVLPFMHNPAVCPPAPPSTASVTATPTAAQSKLPDLEIKDAQVIFDSAWSDLEAEVGREHLRFPKEFILLGGAPGSGKGTNTRFILNARGLTCEPVVISALLDSPEAKRIKDAGAMVGDREVVSLLLRRLLLPIYRDGVILDGFPRTKVQVECLKRLVARMQALRIEFHRTSLGIYFRQPTIHIMVLFVDEKTSIERQLSRGREVKAHNAEVLRSGEGEPMEERATDYKEGLARRRYRVFKEQTWDALQSLKEVYYYHFINAQGEIAEVEQNILKELQYQSSLELDPRTHERLRSLPLASQIVVHARQELVKRLDSYELEHTKLFEKVVGVIDKKIMPIVLRHAISGVALVNSEDSVFDESLALAMLIDVYSERGYHAVVDLHRLEIPERVDLSTGAITTRLKKVFRIQIRFQGSEIRRG